MANLVKDMALLNIRVQPGASRNEIVEMSEDGILRIRVTAPPVDGKANAAVIKLLAKHLRVPSRALSIVRGMSSRSKVVEVDGVSNEELRQKL